MKLAGFEPPAESVAMEKFLSHGDWHVTPDESRFIASRLDAGIAQGVPEELLSFFDDAPPTEDVVSWLEEFAAFNGRAAEYGGYRVR